jgi:hypothetical protein
MEALGRVITEAIVHHYGRDEFLRRLAQPFWFQSFGAVMGMDWHSSGITTSVLGALKRGLAPLEDELGLYVCGGRGRHSRKTPDELLRVGERTGLDGDALARDSRLIAKVDSAAVQDGFDLYLHGFVATAAGNYCVVQQGMNGATRKARRYHWLSEGLQSFVDAPHAAIAGEHRGTIVNLTDARASEARRAQVELVREGPTRVVAALRKLRAGPASLALFELEPPQAAAPEAPVPHLSLPDHHDVRASDVLLRRLHAALAAASERGPRDFAELLLTPGIGARTVFSLAQVAEVVHGAPYRFSDPARFSFAHGGKDGHPFPVPLRVYDETIRVMKQAVEQAKLGREEKLAALTRLDREARRLEDGASGPSFSALIAEEKAHSPEYGGRTVFDRADARESASPKPRVAAQTPSRPRDKAAQLRLPGLGRG